MVFKKFTDRLISAGTTAANTLINGPEQAEKIRQLESMGFSAERARHALNATGGDVDRAAELLLLGGGEDQTSGPHTHNNDTAAAARGNNNNNHHYNQREQEGTHVQTHNDEQMRRAIEESLQVNNENEARHIRQTEVASMDTENNKKKEVIDLTSSPARKKPATKATATAQQKKPPATTTKQPAKKQATTNNKNGVISAAAINAGKAAANRINNNDNNTNNTYQMKTLDETHPNITLPQKLSHKTKEEQILRTAQRLKPHVMAVDTLLRVLTSVRDHPDNAKFRTIDRTNTNYVKYVRDKPGAEDLLLAMNYRKLVGGDINELRLERHRVDEALLFLGISALEQMRLTEEYIENKKLRAFHAEMKRVGKLNSDQLQSTGMTDIDTDIRSAYLSKCPKEPPEGRGAWMFVYLGGGYETETTIEGGKVKRRFDGDDTLEDVMNWLGGCYGNEVVDKIYGRWSGGESREWCLCDLNRYPIMPLDVEKHKKKTLQYLGLFPSGKLGVRLSTDGWRDREEGTESQFDIIGSARGLGAASRSMLH